MATLTNMIDEVSMNLSGYTLTQDRSTYISSAVAATASSSASPIVLSLGSTDNVGKGIVEINEELLPKELQIQVSPEQAYFEEQLIEIAAKELKISPTRIAHLHIKKRSIDARKRKVKVNLLLEIFVDEKYIWFDATNDFI